MFGSYKKIKEMQKDPIKALEYAEKKMNKGVSGFMTKAVMGKDYVNDLNKTLESGKKALETQQMYQDLSQTGLPAAAEVISIQDTGKLINFNPVVILQLKVQPQFEPEFEATAETVVSKIAIPRVGDTIQIKYAPSDRTKIAVL